MDFDRSQMMTTTAIEKVSDNMRPPRRTLPHWRFYLAALFVAVCGTAGGHEHEDAPQPFTARQQFAPTPLPDRVVVTWAGDPRTSIDVTWRTDVSAADPIVEFAPASQFRGNFRDGVIKFSTAVAGTSQNFTSDLGGCQIHSAQLRDLVPNTMYAYRVGDGRHWSEWFQFRTAAATPEPFTFVYFGDAQNQIRSLWSRVIREANQHAPRAAFMLHAGDLIGEANSDGQWGEWFAAGGWLNGMIPVVATPGNHEYHDETGLSGHWRPQFAFPVNGPSGLEETAYWFDYQGARIISLNSNERIEEQSAWLTDMLSDDARPRWTIVTFHHPIYSAAKERDNPELRAAWKPIFEQHGVDLVLQGHDHSYARTGPGGPKNVAEGVRAQSGHTVYVVSVSGPKQYQPQETWEVSRAASGVQLFQVLHVAPERLQYEARLASGELYDAFTMTKDGEGRTALVEQVPETAEIRVQIPEDD